MQNIQRTTKQLIAIDKGAAVEVKDLTKEIILIGKVINLERLLDLQKDSSMTILVVLGCNNMNFCSFTFCPYELLELLINSNKYKREVDKILQL